MIQLIGVSLVNWHRFGVADLDFAGNVAILGKNATGKSTLIDLVQAVMTGGSAAFYRFNRSAGEGGGRSDRTLKSYCIGQTDQARPGRTQGITHLALRFGDDGQKTTIGICVEVGENEEAARIVGRYVVEGVWVDTTFFMDHRADGSYPVTWPVLRARIDSVCRDSGGALHEHQSTSATRFIREYMRVLFTGRRAPDPERFIKAFIMALSFEDMRSVEQFVLSYLIEKDDINIADLRESIQRYRQIQGDIAELERKLEALQPIMVEIERLASIAEQEDTAERMRRLADLLDAAKKHYRLLDSRRSKSAEVERLSAELANMEDEIAFSSAELESVMAQISTSGVEAQRHQLRMELSLEERVRDGLVGALRDRHAPVAAATKLLVFADRIKALGLGLGSMLDALQRLTQESEDVLPPAWPRNPARVEEAIAAAASIAEERSAKVATKRDETISLRVASDTRIAEISSRLAESRRGAVSLDHNVAALMKLLSDQGMRPRALCEVIEVVDDRWRKAAEALLGRNRETIIVDPEHAEQAISLMRRERSRFPGCRVANTRKLVGAPHEAMPGTLASVMTSDDRIVMAMVIFRVGSVRLAETQAQLISEGRAIMDDGSYYDGLVVEVMHVRDMKLGRTAASLMVDVLSRELEDERAVSKVHRGTEDLLSMLLVRMSELATPVPDERKLERLSIQLADSDARRDEIAGRLQKVSMTLDPALAESRRRLEKRIADLQEESRVPDRAIAVLKSELVAMNAQITGGAEVPGSRWSVRLAWRLFRERVSAVALFRRFRPLFGELRGEKTDRVVSQELVARLKRLADDRTGCDAVIRDKVSQYLYDFSVQRPFDGNSSIMRDMKPWVHETIEALEGNDLIRYRQQADEAAERVTYLFRTSFVQELNGRFRNVEREIDDLRAALRSKQLHGEIYSLHATVRPEFRDLYNLARASESDDSVLGLLFSSQHHDHPFSAAIGHVETLLKDENASFELYQDYRNYFSFELKMKNAVTGYETTYDRRRGVASGAERQVPFYVVIGAALASIYHGTRRADERPSGMGLAMFDEAFSKMDGENQRTMLDFYNEIGLQVIIAAPTEKRSVVYENLDSIVDVYRFGENAEIESSRIKERVHTAMREANPEHLSDEVLLLKLGDDPNVTWKADEKVQ